MATGLVRPTRHAWRVMDARGKAVGRLATDVAKLLMGKHKPTYSPHMDHGDNVVILNAKDLTFTGKKMKDKVYRWHSGFPGGQCAQIPAALRSCFSAATPAALRLDNCSGRLLLAARDANGSY